MSDDGPSGLKRVAIIDDIIKVCCVWRLYIYIYTGCSRRNV